MVRQVNHEVNTIVICAFHAPFTLATRGRKIRVMHAAHRAHLCYLGAFENGKSESGYPNLTY